MFFLFMDLIDDEKLERKFEDVYMEMRNISYKICNSILHDEGLSEDAVSETFCKIAKNFKRLSTYDDLWLKNYIKLASKHTAIKSLEKNKKLKSELCQVELEKEIEDLDIEEETVSKMSAKEIYEKILLKLPDRYYDVVYSKVVLELTPREIANTLEIPIATVYKRYSRAKIMIKKFLKEE